MAKQIEDSHGESNKEEAMKWLEKEHEEYFIDGRHTKR